MRNRECFSYLFRIYNLLRLKLMDRQLDRQLSGGNVGWLDNISKFNLFPAGWQKMLNFLRYYGIS